MIDKGTFIFLPVTSKTETSLISVLSLTLSPFEAGLGKIWKPLFSTIDVLEVLELSKPNVVFFITNSPVPFGILLNDWLSPKLLKLRLSTNNCPLDKYSCSPVFDSLKLQCKGPSVLFSSAQIIRYPPGAILVFSGKAHFVRFVLLSDK